MNTMFKVFYFVGFAACLFLFGVGIGLVKRSDPDTDIKVDFEMCITMLVQSLLWPFFLPLGIGIALGDILGKDNKDESEQ